jgi:hypothetical protein
MTELSPAAAAIVQAFDERYELLGPLEGNWQEVCLAAALRVLADHHAGPWTGDGPCRWTPTPRTRRELRNIAQELESTPS